MHLTPLLLTNCLKKIYKKIGFHKNLVIQTVNIMIGVMMCNQILHSFLNLFFKSQFSEQSGSYRRPLFFLQFTAAVAVLFFAQMNYEVFKMWKRNEKRIFVLQQGWSI